MADTFLKRRQVEKLTGRSRSSIYEDIKHGKFPAPVPIGDKAVAWLESEIVAWQQARIAERDHRASERQAA